MSSWVSILQSSCLIFSFLSLNLLNLVKTRGKTLLVLVPPSCPKCNLSNFGDKVNSCFPGVFSLSFQSVKPVTTEAEVRASCAPDMRSNQHQVMLLTVQLIHCVMAALRYQMLTTQIAVSTLVIFCGLYHYTVSWRCTMDTSLTVHPETLGKEIFFRCFEGDFSLILGNVFIT